MDVENKYGTLAVQRKLLELLKEFDAHCRREAIDYSVSSGTLLGAVRHKGFIPWDDDIDIIVHRSDYNRLKSNLLSGGGHALTFVEAASTTNWIDRVHLSDYDPNSKDEATLDVFILDNVSDNKLKEKLQLFSVLMLQGMLKPRISLEKGSWALKMCSAATYVMGLPFSRRTKMRWYSRVAQRYNGTETSRKAIWIDQYKALRFRYPKEVVRRVVRIPFEDTEVNAFEHYDEYLTIIFGKNYMTPPAESNRVPSHIKSTNNTENK